MNEKIYTMGMIDFAPTTYEQTKGDMYSRGTLKYRGELVQNMSDERIVLMLKGARSRDYRMWVAILSCEMKLRIRKYNSENES